MNNEKDFITAVMAKNSKMLPESIKEARIRISAGEDPEIVYQNILDNIQPRV